MKPKIANIGESCCGCGACDAMCAVRAIAMEQDSCGFRYPRVDIERCVACGHCNNVCPALLDTIDDQALDVWWAASLDSDILKQSSSGGVFGLLAIHVLTDGGVVYGAAFVDGVRYVQHVRIDDIAELDTVMRSKYVQSVIPRLLYDELRADVKSGRQVLFAGTACQVAGIKGALGRLVDAPNLFCIDVICHGVPSPRLWAMYVDYLAKSEDSEVINVNFRSKATGWQSFSFSYQLQNEVVKTCEAKEDWYFSAFLANATLRPSCFKCPSKRSCGSDLTLGDFWGFEKHYSEIECRQGISAVIANTQKGVDAFTALDNLTRFGRSTYEHILLGNSALERSVVPSRNYRELIVLLESNTSLEEIMRHWNFRPTIWQQVKRKIKSLIGS